LPKLKEKLGKPKINLNSFSIKMLQNLPISGKMMGKKHKLKKPIMLKTLKKKFMSLSMSMGKMDSNTIQGKAQLRNQSENNSQPHQVLQLSNQSEKILGIHQTGSKEKATLWKKFKNQLEPQSVQVRNKFLSSSVLTNLPKPIFGKKFGKAYQGVEKAARISTNKFSMNMKIL
jgi:hypothetical protein